MANGNPNRKARLNPEAKNRAAGALTSDRRRKACEFYQGQLPWASLTRFRTPPKSAQRHESFSFRVFRDFRGCACRIQRDEMPALGGGPTRTHRFQSEKGKTCRFLSLRG